MKKLENGMDSTRLWSRPSISVAAAPNRVGAGFWIVLLATVLHNLACTKTPAKPVKQDESTACTANSDCDPGYMCGSEGRCIIAESCTPGSCPSGQFCHEDLTCRDMIMKCQDGGCDCHILGDGGQLGLSESTTLTFVPGVSRRLQTLVTYREGSPIHGIELTHRVGNESLFRLSGSTLTALESADHITTTLTTQAGDDILCSATLVNLGAAPDDARVRIMVYDELSGAPISDAEVHIDYDNNGTHDGSASPLNTDSHGLSVTTQAHPGGPFTLTVFKQNYNYLSLVGLTSRDVTIPLSPRKNPPTTGGFSGRLDYQTYEDELRDGQPGSIKFGLVGSSFPMKALLNFDLAPFLGEPRDVDCASDPGAAGCYEIDIPGLFNSSGRLPGSVILSLPTSEIKEHFDITTVPGRRTVWAFGGEVEIPELRNFIEVIQPNLTCSGECEFSIGHAIDAVIPLLPRFAMGLHSNLLVGEQAQDEWDTYIAVPYGENRPDTQPPRFPILDTDQRGRLTIEQPMAEFVEFDVPKLPDDPYQPGSAMEGMIILTGINSPGFGLVPMGVGTALDCTSADCSDPASRDGEVNGATICSDTDPTYVACPEGVPEQLQDGHMGLFHAARFGDLENEGDWVTAISAMPIDSARFPEFDMRSATVISWKAPELAAQDLSARDFPAFESIPDSLSQRSYPLPQGNNKLKLHFITLEAQNSPGSQTQRWSVFMAKDGPAFVAPPLPESWKDPFTQDTIKVAQIGFELPDNIDLDGLASNNGTSLNDIIGEVQAVTYQEKVALPNSP